MPRLHATFRRPDEAVGWPTTMENATPARLMDALARLEGTFSLTLWLDQEIEHIARIVAIGQGQYTVEVLIGHDLYTATNARPEVDIAPLPAGAAAVRGVPVVRASQILGVVSAVRVAMTWIAVGRLGERWRYLRP